MYEEIYDWVVAVVSDYELKKKQSLLNGLKQKTDYDKTLSKLIDLGKEYKTNPTWKVYKEFYKASWAFGHPGERDSVRDFQKMTPEKQKVLQERANNRYEWAKEQVDNHYYRQRRDIANVKKEITEIKKRIKPGVSLKGDEAEREFPVNLKGWKYDEKEIKQRIQKQIDAEAKAMEKGIEHLKSKADISKPTNQETLEILERALERIRTKTWKEITVKLTTKPTKGVKAFWTEIQKLLTIIIPDTLQYEGLEGLGKSLRHELQHFAQSYLAYAVDPNILMQPELRPRRPGFPSRKIQTPEFQQQFDPEHPSYRRDAPEVIQLRKRLKDQGLRVRQLDLHALDDIEFYTRLADSIDSFKRLWKHAQKVYRKEQSRLKEQGKELYPPLELRTAVKLFTGTIPYPDSHDRDWHEQMTALGGYEPVSFLKPNEFFRTLKRRAPGKYRKALSEFVKVVT
jgi:hypothetical protein